MKGEEMQTRSVAIRHVVPAVLIWLATPACESSSGLESPELTSGTLTLIIATSGGPGAAHYDVVVDDSIHISASPNDSITVDLGPQHHGFEIRGLGQCTISPSSRKSAGFSFTNEQKVRWFATYVRCPFAPLHGRIVFDGQPANGGFALYSIRSDGTDQWLLLEEESFPLQLGVSEWFVRPQVSPDGRRIASAVLSNLLNIPSPGDSVRQPGIGVISGDSYTVVRLPQLIGSGHDWSPDGNKIVATGAGDGVDLFIENADGSERRRLTADSGNESLPSWSPDGQRIAFVVDECDIAVIDTSGAAKAVIVSQPECETGPAWSPDGNLLAFVRMEEPGPGFPSWHGVLYVVNPDGSGERRVVAPSSANVMSPPTWSPDGKQLAFGTQGTVWVTNVDGTGLRAISGAGNYVPWPDWSR